MELFSGLGGMRSALSLVGWEGGLVAVDLAVGGASEVYRHTWGDAVLNKDISSLSVSWFEKISAGVWTLSPPCQPFTRQGLGRDAADSRAAALLNICKVLEEISMLPELIVLENVEGFEQSESCERFRQVLTGRGFRASLHLSNPLSLGFPNSRSRCFIVASRSKPEWLRRIACTDACKFRERTVGEYLDEVDDDSLIVSDELLTKGGSFALDIVARRSLQSMCFTRGYSRLMNGAGSVLYLGEDAPGWDDMQRPIFNLKKGEMMKLSGKLRFFSPSEIARLQGYCLTDDLLPECTLHGALIPAIKPNDLVLTLPLRAAYRALGNSLNPWSVAFAIDSHFR